MYEYRDVRRAHIELTTRCNASCPQCPRNVRGGDVISSLPIVELSLDHIAKIFQPEFLSQLVHITICGNYGDAIFARDTLNIVQFLRSQNPQLDIELHTNGSARPVKFWEQLARTVNRCVFAIDGLKDTNHLYRRNTDWDTIERNVRAFIGSGGIAIWNFIPFRHNEHQISQAAEFARQVGFKKFYVKRTGRFYLHGELHQSLPIMNSAGQVVGQLELPTHKSLRNPVAEALYDKGETATNYEKELSQAPIRCTVQNSGSIYISAEGFVFPCCWMAQIYSHKSPSKRKVQILKLINDFGGGLEAIDATKRPIEAIIGSAIFQVAIPNGWNSGPERLEICTRQCGPFRLSASQKTSSLI
jgi:MoaA/NifB/PqqE/SkfB family radical SAM enzyme